MNASQKPPENDHPGQSKTIPGESPYTLENLTSSQERSCEITHEALEQLQEWGLSTERIKQLEQLGAKYEYADCLPKLEKMAERGGYITTSEGKTAVVLPEFFDLTDQKGGQCTEITDKMIRDLNHSGWLEETNRALVEAGKEKLQIFSISGIPPKFFGNREDVHTWVGLGPGSKLDDMVVIDGSFLEISKQPSNGYDPRYVTPNPERSIRAAARLQPVGELSYDEQRWRSDIPEPIAIGLTNDRSLLVCLGFLSDQTAKIPKIQPIIQLQGPEEATPAICTRIPEHGIVWGDQSKLTNAHVRAEAERLLVEAERTPLIRDDNNCELALQQATSLQLR